MSQENVELVKASYAGGEGFVQTVRDGLDAFEQYNIEADEFLDAGDDVVVSVRISGIGRESGAIVNMHLFHVWTVLKGKELLGRTFPTRAEALEAVGLSEQDAHAGS